MGRIVEVRTRIDGEDVSDLLLGRIKSLTITDGKRAKDDGATLELIDTRPRLEWPEGARRIDFSVRAGGAEWVQVGPVFQLDTPVSSGGAGKVPMLSVKCSTIPRRRPSPQGAVQSNFGGDSQTVVMEGGEDQQTVANFAYLDRERSVVTAVHIDPPELAQLRVQGGRRDETPGEQWARTMQEHGISVRIRDGEMYITEHHPQRTVRSRQPIGEIEIPMHEITGWTGARVSVKANVRRAEARWHNPATGERGTETVGSGSPHRSDRRVYRNAAEARTAARRRLHRARSRAREMTLTVHGRPEYAASGRISTAEEIRPGIVAGPWEILKVTHKIASGSAYTSTLNLGGV